MLCLVVITILAGYIRIQAQAKYAGCTQLKGLSKDVKVYFDKFGVPHVYAKSEVDAYFALGYLHAQERLAQLDLFRRLSTGKLAEMLGVSAVATDKLIRTVGITENAKESARLLRKGKDTRFKAIMFAYLDGLNEFVATGPTPPEFEILGISKEKFVLEDLYSTVGFLAFQLSLGFRSELVIDKIRQKLGDKYLKDLEYQFGSPVTPAYTPLQKGSNNKFNRFRGFAPVPQKSTGLLPAKVNKQLVSQKISARVHAITGIPTWLGSNAWVLSGKKTHTEKVMLSNDTHLGVGQPGFWYEAHINFPGESLYGYIHPLNPAFFMGHNKSASFGVTALLVDDLDFYQEKYKPGSTNQIVQDGKWSNLILREETIKVKGGKDVKFVVRSTRRGPIVNEVVPDLTEGKQPVSMFWVYNKFPNSFIESFYRLSMAKNLNEAEKAVSINVSPCLNVLYGNKNGDIAWWTSAKMIKRKPGIDSKYILDGSNSANEPLGYYDFSQNPKSINPPSGYVVSSNNQPDKVDGKLYPGNYVAGTRQKRLMSLFNQDKKWSNADLQSLFMDDKSPLFVKISQEVLRVLEGENVLTKSTYHKLATQLLKNWEGAHGVKEKAPVVFSKLLYYLVKNTMQDELGAKLFKELLPNPGFMNEVLSRTYPKLFFKEKSLWWDNISTQDKTENRKDVFMRSFDQTVQELSKQMPDTKDWLWGKVHQLTYVNFTQDKRFTVGPFEVSGGMDVVNKFGFALTNNKVHQVSDQPSQRMLVDFSDIENKTWGVLPLGNSGHPKSIFYKDQANMYNKGKLRRQLTNKREIQRTSSCLRLKVK